VDGGKKFRPEPKIPNKRPIKGSGIDEIHFENAAPLQTVFLNRNQGDPIGRIFAHWAIVHTLAVFFSEYY
jgi:hypothetical protein